MGKFKKEGRFFLRSHQFSGAKTLSFREASFEGWDQLLHNLWLVAALDDGLWVFSVPFFFGRVFSRLYRRWHTILNHISYIYTHIYIYVHIHHFWVAPLSLVYPICFRTSNIRDWIFNGAHMRFEISALWPQCIHVPHESLVVMTALTLHVYRTGSNTHLQERTYDVRGPHPTSQACCIHCDTTFSY